MQEKVAQSKTKRTRRKEVGQASGRPGPRVTGQYSGETRNAEGQPLKKEHNRGREVRRAKVQDPAPGGNGKPAGKRRSDGGGGLGAAPRSRNHPQRVSDKAGVKERGTAAAKRKAPKAQPAAREASTDEPQHRDKGRPPGPGEGEQSGQPSESRTRDAEKPTRKR